MNVPALGLVLPDREPIEHDVRFAQQAERAGFETLWCYELTRDSQIRAASVAQHTTTIQIGTCVSLWHSTPVSAAMRVAELQRWGGWSLSPGPGDRDRSVEPRPPRHAEPPAGGAHAGVPRGRPWGLGGHRGGATRPRGRELRREGIPGADLEGRPPPPLLLAAMRPSMVRLAVRAADGIMLSPSATPYYVDEALHARHRSELEARRAEGRPLRVVAVARCSVDRDRRAAWERARRSIAWYAVIPAHVRIAQQHGFGAEAAAITTAWNREDAAGAVAAVSDGMVEAFALVGTADDVRAQLRRWDGIADSVALLTPSEGASPDEVESNVSGVLDAFA